MDEDRASCKIPSNVDRVSKMQQPPLGHFSDPQILSLYCTLAPLDDDMEPSVQQG